MTATTQIEIRRKALHPVTRMLALAIVIAAFVGAIGVSRVWFGGAVVIDLLILMLIGFLCVSIARNVSGEAVTMTPGELRLWVAADMPDNIRDWREARVGSPLLQRE